MSSRAKGYAWGLAEFSLATNVMVSVDLDSKRLQIRRKN